MPVKVLHILGSLAVGGAENLVLDMLRGGSAERFSYHVVYMHPSSAERVEAFAGCGVPVTFIPCGSGVKTTFRFIRNLRGYIKRNGIEVIHCHHNVDAYWACFASRFTPVRKIILSIHGMNLNFNYLSGRTKGLFPADRFITRSLQLTYVSGSTRDFYRDKYGRKELEGRVIYNGVDTGKLDAVDSGTDTSVSAWAGEAKEKNKLLFGMVGNFNTPVRLQMMICRILWDLKGRYRGKLPFIFVFAGGKSGQHPALFEDCVAFCREKGMLDTDVFFPGRVDKVPQLLAGLDGYIYGSSADTFGISVIEAVMAGVPVICSDIPALREVTFNGELATLVRNEIPAFGEAVTGLVCAYAGNKNTGIKNSPGTIAKAAVARSFYSIEKCRAAYEALYLS